jgi:hypothetical protein
MPSPGSTSSTMSTGMRDMLNAIAVRDEKPATKADVESLRDEIAELRNALMPPGAIIPTGTEVFDHSKRLRR